MALVFYLFYEDARKSRIEGLDFLSSDEQKTSTESSAHPINTINNLTDNDYSNELDTTFPLKQSFDIDNDNISYRRNSGAGEHDLNLPRGMDLDDIPEEYKENPDEFFELLEKRRNNNLNDEQKQILDPILFTLSTPETSSNIFSADRFSPLCIRVFAAFSSKSENMKERDVILVKWYDSAGQTVLFQYLPINKNVSTNYVWKEKNYWETGSYTVDIFELDNQIRPLASGAYTIEDMEEYISYLALHGSNEETFSRNTFSSGEEIFLRFNYSSKWSKGLPLKIFYHGEQKFIFEDAVQMDAYVVSTGKKQIKYLEDVWRKGAYEIFIQSEQGNLLNKTIFYITD